MRVARSVGVVIAVIGYGRGTNGRSTPRQLQRRTHKAPRAISIDGNDSIEGVPRDGPGATGTLDRKGAPPRVCCVLFSEAEVKNQRSPLRLFVCLLCFAFLVAHSKGIGLPAARPWFPMKEQTHLFPRLTPTEEAAQLHCCSSH